MQLTAQHKEYWRRNLRLTGVLLAIWFVVTYVMAWYARPLAEINFFGWPLSFYMAAQGSLIIYVVLIYVYAKKMRKLDLEYNVEERRRIMAATTVSANRAFFNQLRKYYTWYTGGFIVFLLVLALADKWACRGSTSATRSCSLPLPCTQALGL